MNETTDNNAKRDLTVYLPISGTVAVEVQGFEGDDAAAIEAAHEAFWSAENPLTVFERDISIGPNDDWLATTEALDVTTTVPA